MLGKIIYKKIFWVFLLHAHLSISLIAQAPSETLKIAVDARDIPAIRSALDAGAKWYNIEKRYQSVILIPAQNADLEVLSALLEKEVKTDHITKNIMQISLSYLIIYSEKEKCNKPNFMESAQLLLKKGAEINVKYQDRTPLMYAVQNDCKDLVKYLLKNGGKVNLNADREYEHGKTAVHYAVSRGRKEILEILLRHGAQLNDRDARGWSALHSALEGRNNVEMLKLLVKKGIDVNAKNAKGDTALMLAAQSTSYANSEPQPLKPLIELGANPNLLSNSGDTALDYALKNNTEINANYLKSIGAKRSYELKSVASTTENAGAVCLSYKTDGSLTCSSAPLNRITCPGARNWRGMGICAKLSKMKVHQLPSEWSDVKSSYAAMIDNKNPPEVSDQTVNSCFAKCMADCDRRFGSASITKKDSYGRGACTSSCTNTCPGK